MSKTPEEMAYEYGEKFDGVEISKNDINIAWYTGYKAAQAIVEEELQAVQAQRVEHPGLGSAEYALKNVLVKMGGK